MSAEQRFGMRSWYAIAAFAAAAAVIAGVTIPRLGHRPDQRSSAQHSTYATQSAQRATVTLADGSQATLAPQTTLDVQTDVVSGATTVRVEGQALFHVAHHSNAPFIVQTADAETRVLGTSFVVRKYSTDRGTHVVVADGRVSLQGERARQLHIQPSILDAGSLGVIGDSGDVSVTPHVAVNDYTAWTTGRLVFHQTPVRDIVAELARAYGVTIQVPDSVLGRRAFTWSVSVTQNTLHGALDALSDMLDAHVNQLGDTLVIVPGRKAQPRSAGTRKIFTSETQYGK